MGSRDLRMLGQAVTSWRQVLEGDKAQQRHAGGAIIHLIMSAAQREMRSGLMSWIAHRDAGRLWCVGMG